MVENFFLNKINTHHTLEGCYSNFHNQPHISGKTCWQECSTCQVSLPLTLYKLQVPLQEMALLGHSVWKGAIMNRKNRKKEKNYRNIHKPY